MKTRYFVFLGFILLASAVRAEDLPPAQAAKQAPAELKTTEDKASYGIGYEVGRDLGRQFKGQGMKVSLVNLLRGLQDGFAARKSIVPDKERMAAMNEHSRACLTEFAKSNKEKGEAFLKTNGGKKGVVTTDSGLQYRVIKEGKGATPQDADTVSVHYHGTLIDGAVFDSSLDGDPLKIPVMRVIPGWTEALKLMKVGDKWQVVIPADLAYGVQGSPPDIGPNSVLVFDMELLGIE